MAILAVAVSDSLAGVSPRIVLRSLWRVPLQYLTTCLLLGGVLGLSYLFDRALARGFPVPVVYDLVGSFAVLYSAAVEARLLGLLYWHNRERLDWF
jgi:hypothetical protein